MNKREIYHITELLEGVYRIGNSGVYMDLLVGSHHALLWDTGYGFGDLYGLVREITSLPLYVGNSHGHVDHACGNWQFGEVFIHPADMALCREHNSPRMRMLELEGAELPEDFSLEEYLHQDCGRLVPVGEGQIFDLGGITLEVVALPGHTGGSIGLLWQEKKLLYVGDAMNDFVWLFLPEALGLEVYHRTLRKAMEMDFDWMLQSHHGDILPKSRLNYYMDLAEHLDYDRGQTVPAPGMPGKEAKICIRGGLTLEQRDREDFAAILISEDKLDG